MQILNNYHKQQIFRMKDAYLVCPNDWVELTDLFMPSEKSTYAYAVKSSNTEDIPIFIFFSNKRFSDLTEEMMNEVYASCKQASLEFSESFNRQIPAPNRDDIRYYSNLVAWRNSPKIDVYSIMNKDEITAFSLPPYGAMIISD